MRHHLLQECILHLQVPLVLAILLRTVLTHLLHHLHSSPLTQQPQLHHHLQVPLVHTHHLLQVILVLPEHTHLGEQGLVHHHHLLQERIHHHHLVLAILLRTVLTHLLLILLRSAVRVAILVLTRHLLQERILLHLVLILHQPRAQATLGCIPLLLALILHQPRAYILHPLFILALIHHHLVLATLTKGSHTLTVSFLLATTPFKK